MKPGGVGRKGGYGSAKGKEGKRGKNTVSRQPSKLGEGGDGNRPLGMLKLK
jgi:hypothetical protein